MIRNRRCNNSGHGINVIRGALVCVCVYMCIVSHLREVKLKINYFRNVYYWNSLLLNVTPCSVTDKYWHFRGGCCFENVGTGLRRGSLIAEFQISHGEFTIFVSKFLYPFCRCTMTVGATVFIALGLYCIFRPHAVTCCPRRDPLSSLR